MFPFRAHRLFGYHRGVPLGWCDKLFCLSTLDVLMARIISYCAPTARGAFQLFYIADLWKLSEQKISKINSTGHIEHKTHAVA